MSIIIKRFTKFIKCKDKGKFRNKKKENQASTSNNKCYGYGESGHVRDDCQNNKKR